MKCSPCAWRLIQLSDIEIRSSDHGNGTGLSRQGNGQPNGNGDCNPGRRVRSRLNGYARLTSTTTALAAAALHLESECMPSPGGQHLGMTEALRPVDPSPKGYHTPSRRQSW